MKSTARAVFVAEPPPQYRVRPAVVVDCSLLSAVLFDEPERLAAEQLLAGRRLVAPALIDHEFVNVAVKKQRRGLPPAVVQKALADYAEHEIELMPTLPHEQFALALRYELSAYDAAYLWLAAECRLPLMTFDQRLGTAAQTHLRTLE